MLIGAGATNQMLGLSNFVKDSNAAGQTAALGFTTTEQASMLVNAGSLAVNTTANENALVELIQSTMFQVPNANAILGSRNMIARLTSIAERRRMLGSMITEFGTLIMTFNGVPLVPLPVTALPTTESDGTNANCSSIYIARFAEEQGVCWITNSGFYFQDFQDAEVQPQGIARLQFFTNLSVERVDALRRISRIVL